MAAQDEHKLIPGTTLVSVDIETTGGKFSNKVMAVGFAIGDKQGNIYELKQFNLEFSNEDFSKKCFEEFWVKYPEQILELKKNALPQAQGWTKICEYIDGLEQKYSKLKFVTDNASFDHAFINYNLERYCDRLPMRYSSTGKYRSVVAPDDMLAMIPDQTLEKLMAHLNKKYPHDHNPVNDAVNIYHQYVYALKIKDAISNTSWPIGEL